LLTTKDAPEPQIVRNWKNIAEECLTMFVPTLLLPHRQVFLAVVGYWQRQTCGLTQDSGLTFLSK